MLRQVVTGAAAVMTVGLLAVGCGSDGDTIIGSTGGILNNNDQFPASSIFTNNVWVDGGGFSPNDADLNGYRVVWSCDCADSDGEFQGDNSAIVLFQVTDVPGGQVRQFVSHYNGQNFTQPEQLIGVDQNEGAAPGPLGSIVALQLNTSDYTTSVQADQARVRSNDDAWLVVWSANTFTNNPQNNVTQVQSNTVGPHRTIYYTVFRKESRDTNETTVSDFIGTTNPVTLRHGWVLPGIEIVPAGFRSGQANDTVNAGSPANPTAPSDVQSFGLISDGFCGQTDFGSNGLPALGTGAGTASTSFTRATPSVNGALLATGTTSTLRSANFRGGERTTMVQVFYTQNINSMVSGGTSLAIGQSGGANAQSNGRIAAFNASLNLTTLQFETPAEFRPVAARNANSSATTSAGTGFYPTFHGYNNQVFYKYLDASLGVGTNVDPLAIQNGAVGYAYDNVGGHEGGVMNSTAFYEDIIGVATFVNDGDGTSSIVTGSILDLAAHTSAAGSHDLTNPTVGSGNTINVAPNREIQNFNLASGSKGGQFIFGADEGLGDTTIFYTSADNTRAGGADSAQNNIVRAGYAAAINPGAGTLVAGGPFVWSAHRGAHHNAFLAAQPLATGAEDVKKDPLVAQGGSSTNGGDNNHDIVANTANDEDAQNFGTNAWYFDATINRTGEYILITYLQDLGTSLGFHRAVNVVTYQPFRTTAGTTGAQTGTQVNVNLRFTAPLEVSQTGAPVAITQPTFTGTTGAETQNRYDALPANSACVQDKIDYRCAYQSNNRVLHVLWEQSDGTEDRLFSRRITFAPQASGTPTQNVLGTIVEYETNNLVAANLNSNDLNPFTHRTTFTALDRTFSPIFGGTSGLVASDLGATDSQGANSGSLFLVFAKVTDATSSDGDFGNAEVFLVTNVNDAITNRISIGRAVNEDFTTNGAAVAGAVGTNQSTNPANVAPYNATSHAVASVLCVNASSITNIAQSPTSQPNALYIYFTAPASGSTNGSGFTGLFTRKVNLETFRSGQNGTTFAGSITPSAGLTGPGTTGYVEPARLDHNLHSNVVSVTTAQNGTGAMVLWRQDHHLWGQITTNGTDYFVENGGPNPALVDQDSSADTLAYSLSVCTDSDCNVRNAAIGIEKYDFNGQGSGAGTAGNADLRLHFRANTQF